MTASSTDVSRAYLKFFYDVLDFLDTVREYDDNKVWCRVLEKLALALDAEAATYFCVPAKTRLLTAHHAVGLPLDQLAGFQLEFGQGICGWVAMHREPALVQDAYKDQRF